MGFARPVPLSEAGVAAAIFILRASAALLHGQSLRKKDESDTMLSPSRSGGPKHRGTGSQGAESYKTSSADIATQGRRAQGRLNVEHLQTLAIQPHPRQIALYRHLP